MSRPTTWSLAGTLLLVPLAFTGCGGGDQPGALGTEGAHEHGVARVNVAMDGALATIEFVSPAMGIYGFEHEAVSEEDQARQAQGIETLRTRFAEMFVFEPGLDCRFEPIVVGLAGDDHAHDEEHAHDDEHAHEAEHAHEDEHAHEAEDEHAHEEEPARDPAATTPGAVAEEHDHGHAEVRAEFTVTCASPLAGSRMSFAVGEVFPGIDQLDVQVLGERTVGGRYRATGTGVDL